MLALAWAAISLSLGTTGAWALTPEIIRDKQAGLAITDYAVALVGRPYRAGGVTPERGFDCSGFVRHVFETVGQIRLPRRARDMASQGRKIKLTHLEPGDLVFYNTQGSPYSHVGIYLGDGLFIHAPSSGGSVRIVEMNSRYWVRHYSGALRVLESTHTALTQGTRNMEAGTATTTERSSQRR